MFATKSPPFWVGDWLRGKNPISNSEKKRRFFDVDYMGVKENGMSNIEYATFVGKGLVPAVNPASLEIVPSPADVDPHESFDQVREYAHLAGLDDEAKRDLYAAAFRSIYDGGPDERSHFSSVIAGYHDAIKSRPDILERQQT